MTTSPTLALVPEPAPDALDVALDFGRSLDEDLSSSSRLAVVADPSGSPVALLADVVRVLAVEPSPVAPGRLLATVVRVEDGVPFGTYLDRLEPAGLSFEDHVRTALSLVEEVRS